MWPRASTAGTLVTSIWGLTPPRWVKTLNHRKDHTDDDSDSDYDMAGDHNMMLVMVMAMVC